LKDSTFDEHLDLFQFHKLNTTTISQRIISRRSVLCKSLSKRT